MRRNEARLLKRPLLCWNAVTTGQRRAQAHTTEAHRGVEVSGQGERPPIRGYTRRRRVKLMMSPPGWNHLCEEYERLLLSRNINIWVFLEVMALWKVRGGYKGGGGVFPFSFLFFSLFSPLFFFFPSPFPFFYFLLNFYFKFTSSYSFYDFWLIIIIPLSITPPHFPFFYPDFFTFSNLAWNDYKF